MRLKRRLMVAVRLVTDGAECKPGALKKPVNWPKYEVQEIYVAKICLPLLPQICTDVAKSYS